MPEELMIQRFNLSPRSPLYSKDWEYVKVFIDHNTRELVTVYKARVNDTYDKEMRVKL